MKKSNPQRQQSIGKQVKGKTSQAVNQFDFQQMSTKQFTPNQMLKQKKMADPPANRKNLNVQDLLQKKSMMMPNSDIFLKQDGKQFKHKLLTKDDAPRLMAKAGNHFKESDTTKIVNPLLRRRNSESPDILTNQYGSHIDVPLEATEEVRHKVVAGKHEEGNETEIPQYESYSKKKHQTKEPPAKKVVMKKQQEPSEEEEPEHHWPTHVENTNRFNQLLALLKSRNIQVLKAYQVDNSGVVVGKGGFGVVFKGTWLNRDVAIKEMVISYDEFKTMQAELEFLAKCRFPTMIEFYGVFLKELTPDQTIQCSLVMELMEMDLDNYIFKNPGGKKLKDLVKILLQVSQAISFLHQSDVVHRDIKPQNVLLDANKNAKLTDLGIAKVLENKQQTQNATLAYTARYASPETALEEVTSFKSDIWSLGILCYEVLSERRAWEWIDKQSKIIVALSKSQSPLKDGWEKLIPHPKLVDMIKNSVNYDPKARYSACEIEKICQDVYNSL